MKVAERRNAIINLLTGSRNPISGAEISEKFSVSRQIIVQDISALKVLGYEILSTHSGYVLQKSPHVEKVFKLKHTTQQTEDELNSIVDNGGTVVDVFVWHKVYGKISAPLNIFSRLQVKQFIEGVRTGKSTELMNITGGYHYHTVRAENQETIDKISSILFNNGYVVNGD
ncbi:MAG: transcription repressor NadR [Clostridia bacterium]|nr:transcription repressor NadR [Clostridia bacterium]